MESLCDSIPASSLGTVHGAVSSTEPGAPEQQMASVPLISMDCQQLVDVVDTERDEAGSNDATSAR